MMQKIHEHFLNIEKSRDSLLSGRKIFSKVNINPRTAKTARIMIIDENKGCQRKIPKVPCKLKSHVNKIAVMIGP
ncbi:MAG: hypothetical protein ACOC4M_16305, partial [Promethearchaeia archaeon]